MPTKEFKLGVDFPDVDVCHEDVEVLKNAHDQLTRRVEHYVCHALRNLITSERASHIQKLVTEAVNSSESKTPYVGFSLPLESWYGHRHGKYPWWCGSILHSRQARLAWLDHLIKKASGHPDIES